MAKYCVMESVCRKTNCHDMNFNSPPKDLTYTDKGSVLYVPTCPGKILKLRMSGKNEKNEMGWACGAYG